MAVEGLLQYIADKAVFGFTHRLANQRHEYGFLHQHDTDVEVAHAVVDGGRHDLGDLAVFIHIEQTAEVIGDLLDDALGVDKGDVGMVLLRKAEHLAVVHVVHAVGGGDQDVILIAVLDVAVQVEDGLD